MLEIIVIIAVIALSVIALVNEERKFSNAMDAFTRSWDRESWDMAEEGDAEAEAELARLDAEHETWLQKQAEKAAAEKAANEAARKAELQARLRAKATVAYAAYGREAFALHDQLSDHFYSTIDGLEFAPWHIKCFTHSGVWGRAVAEAAAIATDQPSLTIVRGLGIFGYEKDLVKSVNYELTTSEERCAAVVGSVSEAVTALNNESVEGLIFLEYDSCTHYYKGLQDVCSERKYNGKLVPARVNETEGWGYDECYVVGRPVTLHLDIKRWFLDRSEEELNAVKSLCAQYGVKYVEF